MTHWPFTPRAWGADPADYFISREVPPLSRQVRQTCTREEASGAVARALACLMEIHGQQSIVRWAMGAECTVADLHAAAAGGILPVGVQEGIGFLWDPDRDLYALPAAGFEASCRMRFRRMARAWDLCADWVLRKDRK